MSPVETVAVLITDLVGSTAMESRLGPAQTDRIRGEHFSLLRGPISASGGREVKTTGDGVVVVFGTATAALECAVAMQQSLEQRNRKSESELLVRVGVSIGQADVREEDYYGRPVNEAARLCASAQGGEILLNGVVKTIDAGRSGLVFDSVGELHLKGLAPLSAYKLRWEPLEESKEPGRLPVGLYGLPVGGYFGRRRELGVLRRLWEEVRGGERRVALVAGEPGIGKTRLCAHAALEMHRRGTTVLYGRCEQDIVVAYEPWVQLLGHYVQTASREVLREHVAHEGGELGRLLPELEHRVGELPPARSSDPDVERYLLFRAVVGLLRRAARERPVLLILDDVHWADANTLLLLRHVVAETAADRLLVLAAYRTTEVAQNEHLLDALADLPRHQGIQTLDLSGLEHSEVIELMEGAAGHELDSAGRELSDEIFRETDGNPFFVGELLRHLRETGVVVEESDGRWRVTGSLAEIGLPKTVRGLIRRRIERLGPEVASVLRIASVIGPQFDLGLLARVAERDEEELLDLLDGAVRAALVMEAPRRPGRFSFAHALVAHTLYTQAGAARAVQLHRRVAEALEGLPSDELGSSLAELAAHWAAAGDATKAIEYSHRAAKRALQQLAPEDAARWFKQALRLHRAGIEGDDELSCDLLTGLGRAQRQAGDAAYRDRLLEAAGVAERLGDYDRMFEAAIANNRGLYSTLGAIDRERITVLEDCLANLPEADLARRAVVAALLAAERSFDPDDRSRQELAKQAIAMARKSGDPFTLAVTLGRTFVPLATPDSVELRRGHAREVRDIATRLGDDSALFWSDWIEQKAAIEDGDLATGAAAIADMSRLADDIGEPTMNWLATALQSTLLALHGSFDEAEQVAERAAAVGKGEPDSLPAFAAQLAYIRWAQGRMQEVGDLLDQAVRMAPRTPAYALAAAMGYAETGRATEAITIARRWAGSDLAAIPWDTAWATAVAILGVVIDDTREREMAAALHRRVRPWAHLVAHTHVVCYGPLSLYAGMAAAVSRNYEEAETLLAQAVHDNERMDAPFLLSRAHLAWGRMLDERAAPGDHERANEHYGNALALARRYGCAWVAREASRPAAVGASR